MKIRCRLRKWGRNLRNRIIRWSQYRRIQIITWFAPNLLPELNRLVWLTDANLDLHSALNIPYNPVTFKIAFDNARQYDPLIRVGRATANERLVSFVKICETHKRNEIKSKGDKPIVEGE